jgi:hypothetical protein
MTLFSQKSVIFIETNKIKGKLVSVFIKENGKRTIPRLIYIKILVFVILVFLFAITLKPVQTALGSAITGFRTNLIERLETAVGIEIRYASIRPSFISSLDIRNLKIFKDGREIFNVPRARFYFSIRELIFKRKIVFNTIQIDRPAFHVDLDRDRNAFELFKNMTGKQGNGNEIFSRIAEYLPKNADYRIRNCSVLISGGDSIFQIGNMNVNIKGSRDGWLLDAKFDSLLKYAGLFDRTLIIKTGMGIKGSYLPDLEEISVNVSLLELNCFEQNVIKTGESFFRPAVLASPDNRLLFSLKPLDIGLVFREGSLNLISAPENPAFDYNFSLDTKTRGIFAQINLHRFIPNSIVTFSDYWKNTGFLLNREISGSLSLKTENDGSFDYSIFLQSGNLSSALHGDTVFSDILLTDSFLINAYGSREKIFINDFYLNASAKTKADINFQGIVNFSGSIGFFPFKPEGTLSVENFTMTGKESVNGVFDISGRGRDIRIESGSFVVGSYSHKNFEMNFSPTGNEIAVSVSSLSTEDESLLFEAVINKKPQRFEASLSVGSFSLFSIAEILSPFTGVANIPSIGLISRDILFDGEFFLSSDFSNVAYNAPGIILKNDKTIALLSISGTNHYFSLNEGIFYLDKNELIVSAAANFSNPMDLDFSVKADYLDVSWNIEGQILDRNSLVIRDPAGLHAYGSISNSGSVSGYVEGIDFPLPAKTTPAFADFFMSLRYNSADFWSVDISGFNIKELYSHNGRVNFGFSGTADQDGAVVNNIKYADNIGEISGSADFSWNRDFSAVNFGFNMADGNENGELCFFNGTLADNEFRVKGSASNMRIDRFIKGKGVMLASAGAEISWNSSDSFTAQIDLSSFYAKVNANAVEASMEMLFSNNVLYVQNLNLDYAKLKTVFPEFRIDTAEGTGKISADFQGFAGERKVNGKMDLNANFNGIGSWMNIKKAFNSFDGTLQFRDIVFGSLTQENVLFVFSGDEKTISFSGGINDMIKLEMDRKGSFFASLSAPLPIRGSFAGVFDKGNMDAYCSDFYIDMESLWSLAAYSVDDFKFTGGYVTGKMNFRGPFWNPEFYGTGTAASIRIQVPGFVSEDIKPVPFSITAEGYEMTFGPVITASGRGGGTVDGWFRFEYWVPRNVGLNINIPRESPIPYNISIANFLADGNASGKLMLELNSNDRIMEIKGDLFMNNTEMSVNMEGISSDREIEAYNTNKFNTLVELSIITGPMVEFFWPNKNSPLLRANPEMGTVFHISSDNLTGQYSMVSDIKIRSGEVHYFDRNFYIRQGSLVFRENETQFNPKISARAEIREHSDTSPVTISMIIDNQPLLSFVPRFESSPSLTQLEIYTILGQNLYNAPGNDIDAQRFLIASSTDIVAQFVAGSDILSQVLYFRQFERSARKFLHLDMLSIKTRFLQNAVVSTGSVMFGQYPVDRIGRFGNYFDNTTVFIGKYVGQDMFVQGKLALRYDGSSAGFGGLRLEPDIEIEWRSPFINIRWDFFPYHPQNWWVNDNSITLLWRKSF